MRGGGGIWDALRAARRTEGAPPPCAAEPGLTRRRLVTDLAAAAGVSLAPIDAFAATSRPKVAIVGGGIAGLTALDTLVRAGVEAELYEARGAVGGRMRTTLGALGEGLAVDDGGQLVNSDHADIRGLCARFGLGLVDRRVRPGRDILLDAQGPVANAVLLAQLRPLATRMAADAARVGADAQASHAFDRMSAADYLDRARPGGLARRLLENGIRTEYGVEPPQASALELLWNLPGIEGEHLEALGASDERYAIAGGSQRLTDALARRHTGRIHVGRVLQRIGETGAGLSLHFANGQTVTADRVIVAVPAALYGAIAFDLRLPPLWRAFLGEIGLGRVEKLLVGFDSRPWAKIFGAAGSLWGGDGFAEAWDATVGQPGLARGALVYFCGGALVDRLQAGEPAELARAWTAQADRAAPGLAAARNGHVRRTDWARDPFTRGGYVNYRPGQLTRFAPLLWTPKPGPLTGRAGRLSFVGEHLSDAFPGYMNGAAETGRMAAEAIAAEAHRAAAG